MDRIKKVSFVIPCYRSEHTLPHVVKEIRETMQKLTQYTYDIFLVNDASPDNTMGTIRELCEKYGLIPLRRFQTTEMAAYIDSLRGGAVWEARQ